MNEHFINDPGADGVTLPYARNVKQCDLCRGPVDRYHNHFQCRSCGAIGDLFTGIMTDLRHPDDKQERTN